MSTARREEVEEKRREKKTEHLYIYIEGIQRPFIINGILLNVVMKFFTLSMYYFHKSKPCSGLVCAVAAVIYVLNRGEIHNVKTLKKLSNA